MPKREQACETDIYGAITMEKSEMDRVPESLMRKGRRDPSGWVIFVPIYDEKTKVEGV